MTFLINPHRFGAANDPHWASVVLLCDFDGADGSTTFTDLSGSAHTLTAVNSAQIDTAQAKFGAGSLLLARATSDRVTAPDSADWSFGSGVFTMEAHIRFATLPASGEFMGLFGQGLGSGGADDGWSVYTYNNAGSMELRFFARTSGSGASAANAFAFSADAWYHVAVVRSSNTLYSFVDGVLLGGGDAFSLTMPNVTPALELGTSQAAANHLDGWIDNLRITKGVARYTSTFTPPAAAFPTS